MPNALREPWHGSRHLRNHKLPLVERIKASRQSSLKPIHCEILIAGDDVRGDEQTLRADLSLAFCSLLWALGYSSALIFLAACFSVAAVLMLPWSNRALRRFEREDLFAGLRLGTPCFWTTVCCRSTRRRSSL